MTQAHDTIRSALSAEDARLYDALRRSPNPVEAAFATLRGDHPAFAASAWVLGFALFAAALYAGSQFAHAETPRAIAGWAAAIVVAFLALGFVKIWFFMEMQRDALMRRMQRLELQINALANGRR